MGGSREFCQGGGGTLADNIQHFQLHRHGWSQKVLSGGTLADNIQHLTFSAPSAWVEPESFVKGGGGGGGGGGGVQL